MRVAAFRLARTAVIALLALSACAPAAPPALAPPATAPSAPAPATGPAPLVVGATLSLTGANARAATEVNHGLDLWARDVNATGGVLGRPVQFRIYDDATKPENAAKLYERLITDDKVDLILGPYGSQVTAAASAITEKYQFPMIAAGATATEMWDRGFKYLFEMYTAESRYMDGAVELAAEQGAKTVAIMYENTSFAKAVANGSAALAQAKGMQVVLREQYVQNTGDFAPLIQKIKAANADILIGGTDLPDSETFVRQAKDLDLNVKLMAFSVGPGLANFFNDLKDDANAIAGPSQWEPTQKLPGSDAFVKEYKDAYGYEPGYHAAGGYGSGQLLAQAITIAGSADRERLRDTLQTLEATTVFGLYKVDEKGRQIAKGNLLTQWQNGKSEVIWPKDAGTGRPVWPMPKWKERK